MRHLKFFEGELQGPERRKESKNTAVGYWKGWELRSQAAENKGDKLVVFRFPATAGGADLQNSMIEYLHEVLKATIWEKIEKGVDDGL